MKRTFDKCSSTPFLYSSSTQMFISCECAHRGGPLALRLIALFAQMTTRSLSRSKVHTRARTG